MQSVADFPWKWTHVTGTGLVQTGQGVLHTIVLNGLTTAGDITIYDGLTNAGSIIAILHLSIATSISVQPIPFVYDLEFETGLYIEYGDAVADLTVTRK